MWERLPEDVRELVYAHGAAMTIQRSWWRATRYAHARGTVWEGVRAHLGTSACRTLVAYPDVRREWRREAGSWLETDEETLDVILAEARAGMWGKPSRWVP